jgi:ornithine cyclodeaminase/alanine dehydrogenase-like protein (mu-crystallin family)
VIIGFDQRNVRKKEEKEERKEYPITNIQQTISNERHCRELEDSCFLYVSMGYPLSHGFTPRVILRRSFSLRPLGYGPTKLEL